ncbi:MAG: peptidoglycan DD-metalloendopeptidase family protein [Rhizobiales bacterium]|nr:peptidoglycan DD-metalloendopeptidase family protein [Hyphomicrobiales bacterium]
MRSVVLSNRIRCLSQVAVLSLVGAVTVGCSGDSTRFDRALYSAIPKSAPTAYEQAVAANQQYPGDVDTMTTAGIGKSNAPVPLGLIGPRIAASDDGTQYGASQRQMQGQFQRQQIATYQHPNYTNQNFSQPNYNAVPTYNPAPTYKSGVIRGAALPKLSTPTLPTPSIVHQSAGQMAKRVAIDKFKTASISKIQSVKTAVTKKIVAPITTPVKAVIVPVVSTLTKAVDPIMSANVTSQNSGGWSKIGGTTVQMGSGETLYNLSKRYGVPVNAIMSANAINNVAGLKAGQNVVIPTYVYSKSAPVSAPDNHPGTRAARSTYGNLGQPKFTTVPAPSQRPVIAKSMAVKTDYNVQRQAPVSVSSVSIDSIYVVESGDSLRRIAINNNTSVSAIQSANGLSGSNIRIGQKLTIPDAKSSYKADTFNKQRNKLDEISTGAISKVKTGTQIVKTTSKSGNSSLVRKAPKAVQNTVVAAVTAKAPKPPKASGIKSMRWPVSGRVVSKFGSNKKSGRNDGIDIFVPEGTSVKAAENGVVIYSGSELAGFGNLVLIRHDGGLVTAYAYNKSLMVQKGAQVRRGQVIARSGKTGDAETPMLHFEVRKNSRPVNPTSYLKS